MLCCILQVRWQDQTPGWRSSGGVVANDTQIRDLCEQLLVCKDDAQCVMLVTRLRLLLHEHLQDLRNKFMVHAATVSEIEKAS
jgi:hypothetical protein